MRSELKLHDCEHARPEHDPKLEFTMLDKHGPEVFSVYVVKCPGAPEFVHFTAFIYVRRYIDAYHPVTFFLLRENSLFNLVYSLLNGGGNLVV